MPVFMLRRYVSVDTLRSPAGIEFPKKIHWTDGRSWDIEKTQSIQPVPKLTDGSVCFTVIIDGREKKVYRDYKGWYVHPKKKIIF